MDTFTLVTQKSNKILSIILSTLDINVILTTVVNEIQSMIGADRCTLYLIDRENDELYSRVLQAENLVEIRIPTKKSSLAGYSAIVGEIINIKDAYDAAELRRIDGELCFDKRWDEKSGYRTKSVLVMPVPLKGNIIGVFQALNKHDGFSDDDIKIMEQVAFLLGIAVNNALLYLKIEEEEKLRRYIIDDIEEGICILNTKGRILSANRFLEVMSGMRYTTETMVGENFFEIFHNFANTQLEEKINEAFANGFKMIALLEVLEVKIIPYLDEKGKPHSLVLIFTRV